MLVAVFGSEHTHLDADCEPAVGLVAIGMSAGGLPALRVLLQELPAPFQAAIIVAQHTAAESPAAMADLIWSWSGHKCVYATSGQRLQGGIVYVCPAQTHLVVNADATMTLSRKPRLRFVRPSIDWLLESVAAVYQERAVAVLLSGANGDGARGARRIVEVGGTVLVQDPDTCAYPEMPRAAIRQGFVHSALPPAKIANLLSRMGNANELWPKAWDPFAGDDPWLEPV